MKKLFLLLGLQVSILNINVYCRFVDVPFIFPEPVIGVLENVNRAQQLQILQRLSGLSLRELACLYVNDPAIQSVIFDIIGGSSSSESLFWVYVIEERMRSLLIPLLASSTNASLVTAI